MMQVFNFLNARKLREEINIFSGITKNFIFILVVFGILSLQLILITFAGKPFGVYSNYGLTMQQWLISVNFILFRSR
jgi:Ca2+ transporting ATPase